MQTATHAPSQSQTSENPADEILKTQKNLLAFGTGAIRAYSSPNTMPPTLAEQGWIITEINELGFDGVLETIRGSYRNYFLNNVVAIAGRAEPAVKRKKGRNTIRIIKLAMQSSEEQRSIEFS